MLVKEVNENGKKAIGLDWQNNDSACASHVFVDFLTVTARVQRENAYWISRYVKDMNTKQRLPFSFPELRYGLLDFNSCRNCQPLTNWTRWKKRDKVWSSATSLFKWRFRNRLRRCSLSSLLGTLRSEDGNGRENVAEKVNSRSFNLHRDYFKSLTLWNVGEPS